MILHNTFCVILIFWLFLKRLENHYVQYNKIKTLPKHRTSGWMLESYCLTGLTLSNFRGKTIVVVRRCTRKGECYLITIFWRNQTVENIFSWSQQHDKHIDPWEHDVLPKNREHAPHVFTRCNELYAWLQKSWRPLKMMQAWCHCMMS